MARSADTFSSMKKGQSRLAGSLAINNAAMFTAAAVQVRFRAREVF
jgi:hypothetical protein